MVLTKEQYKKIEPELKKADIAMTQLAVFGGAALLLVFTVLNMPIIGMVLLIPVLMEKIVFSGAKK